MSRRRRFLLSCLAVMAVAAAASTAPAQSSVPQMYRIFNALSDVYPLSLDEGAFLDEANRQVILDALGTIAASAERLEEHGVSSHRAFASLARSLSDQAVSAMESLGEGNLLRARYETARLTRFCFACHAHDPTDSGFEMGRALLERVDFENLPLYDQLKLAVGARQFPLALKAGESVLCSPEVPAREIDLSGLIGDYLTLAVRPHTDLGRTTAALEEFSRRNDLPEYLAEYVEAWLESLSGLSTIAGDGEPLVQAEHLVSRGLEMNRTPTDRRGLVYFAAAANSLHRFVGSTAEPEDMAKAYYLLGVAEAQITRSLWPAEIYLETAIHVAPRSPHARDAYLMLEEELLRNSVTSTGVHLPDGVSKRLETLRRLALGS